MKSISRTVWTLSLVSLFTDMASEMLYPILPIYLKSIGFSVVLIGLLEGIAEATAGLSKGYFGKRSDVSGKRVPFVQLGYALSAISKPMMGLFVYPLWIFLARTTDRLGKGIRTGARDALLSDEATPKTKGRIFGLHRSLDTLGAVIGPTLALIYLYFYPDNYRTLFFIAFIPGVMAVFATTLLKDKNKVVDKERDRVPIFSFLSYWKGSSQNYRRLVIGLLAFALINSSDIFLLLKAKEAGLNDSLVIGVYIFYNLIYALFSYPVGAIADKIGLRKMFMIGLSLFVIVYMGMGLASQPFMLAGLFFLYGIYAATNEGIAKAWISNITPQNETATAIGMYSGFQSICTLIASSLAGLVWYQYGAKTAFMLTAGLTLIIVLYFLIFTHSIERGVQKKEGLT